METRGFISLKAATLICIATSSLVMQIGVVCPQVALADSSTETLAEQTEQTDYLGDFPEGYKPPNNGKPKNGRGAGTRT